MAVHRFQIVGNKKAAILKQNKREIATLLAITPKPKEEKARIRAEAVIRDDYTVEAHEILQLNCELLAERIKFISASKECPPEMEGSIATLIWATGRVDVQELGEIRNQFKLKYGKKFIRKCEDNESGIVNERVIARLSLIPPNAATVRRYLVKIAEEYEVKWTPSEDLSKEDMKSPVAAPTGFSVPISFAADQPDGDIPKVPEADSFNLKGHKSEHKGIESHAPTKDLSSIPVVKATYVPNEATIFVPPMSSSAYTSNKKKIGPPSAPSPSIREDIGFSIPVAPSHIISDNNKPVVDDKNKDDFDDDQGFGENSNDYDDLLARFNSLKK